MIKLLNYHIDAKNLFVFDKDNTDIIKTFFKLKSENLSAQKAQNMASKISSQAKTYLLSSTILFVEVYFVRLAKNNNIFTSK